jgi:hypothetical protein
MVVVNDAKTFVDKTQYMYIYIFFLIFYFTWHVYLSQHDLKNIDL